MLRPRVLFMCVALLELAHTGTAISQHRVPGGHDGFQYFTLQYFFLNNAIQAHEVAQWIPFMNQGTVSSLWYGIQGSFLQNILLHVPWLAGRADLLSVFHLGILVDELVLLTGTWLLARRFFDTPALFFVVVSVVGSCVWMDQPYWNFRLYYAIPLVLDLGHRFLDTGRWRWFFLSANLLALQTVGNLPYFIPLVSFVVFAYFASYAAANHRAAWDRVRSLQWRWPAVLAICFGAVSFAAAYKSVTIGTGQLVSYNPGRNPDGTTNLEGFLSFGGFTDVNKWVEVVLGVSPFLDNTLYAGILLAPLLLCGAVVADRRRLHLPIVAGTLLLFTLATPVSSALFHTWPGMTYFRHIGLVSSLVKVLYCFVAGIGFEWLFGQHSWSRRWRVRAAASMCALLLVAGAWWALAITRSPPAIERYMSGLTVARVVRPLHAFDSEAIAGRLQSSAILALCGAAIAGAVPFALAFPLFTRPRAREAMLCAVAAFVAADVYGFKFAHLFDRSDGIGPDQRFVVEPSPMPYAPRRMFDLHQARAAASPRLVATLDFSRLLRRRFDGLGQNGAQYWTNNLLWFADEVNHTFQADSWLAPLDQLARVFQENRPVSFPVDRDAAARIGGLSADKIRFFAHAYGVGSAAELAPLMTDGSFKGDVLFVLPPETASPQALSTLPVPWTSGQALSVDDSRPVPYRVERFDANNLVVRASNREPTSLWMFYSDVWHPSWQATVNGRYVPVYRANMAYKAIPIEPGDNVIHFHFGSTLFSILSATAAANAAFWLGAVGWMMVGIATKPRTQATKPRKHEKDS